MAGYKPKWVTYTEEELLKMKRKEAVGKLNEKQQRFCEYYLTNQNAKIAAIKAGYDVSNTSRGYMGLKNNEQCRIYIAWLKVRIINRQMIAAADIIDEWARIAFSDITDFVNIYPHSISLKPANEMDGQLVKSIKSGRDGISIELHDKMKALDNLIKYVDYMPKDWKQRVEEQKVKLMKEELEMKKKAQGFKQEDDKDDGFIAALSSKAKEIWVDEENS